LIESKQWFLDAIRLVTHGF